MLAKPAQGESAIRLGMIGVAFANSQGIVTETAGKLSNWLKVGDCLSESSTVLLGMDEAMDELRENPGQRLTLPNICLDKYNQQNFHTIHVQWDSDNKQFVISTTTLEATNGSEFDDLREFRAQQYLQERLEEERQHFRTLYERSPHLALCYDTKGQLIAASNDLRLEFLGEAPETSTLHKQLTEGPIWSAMWAGEKLNAHPLKATDCKGDIRELELSGYLVTPPDKLSKEVYYSLADVTERNLYRLHMQERSAELEAATKQLRDSNKRLSRFASVAAHDLLSPLRRIATFTQILGEEFEGPQSESLSFALRAIQHSAERGQVLVDDVMHLTQTASRVGKLEAINPTELLKLVAKDSDLLLEHSKGCINYAGTKHYVMGDAKLLRSVYRNLLSNAIKFRDPERPLKVTHTVSDTGTGHVRIEFKDNGIGFNPEGAEQVFEPFTRLVGEDQVPGTGLGLSIVQEAMKAMGSQVSASSIPGVGTTIALMVKAIEK